MTNGVYGVSAYQQTSEAWKANSSQSTKSNAAADAGKKETADVSKSSVKTSTWSPIDTTSSLVPKVKDGYGTTIGDVELSDKAKDYYAKLKAKYNNSEFILVSKDMKAQVQANAAAYGNAHKMVVLIDEEKIERMANDESFRKKYEGIIAMAQTKMSEAKASLSSSGASVKNFGMSVNSDGTTDFFASLEKSSEAQMKRLEKKRAEKKAAKVKEKKKAEKKEKEERLEKTREERKEAKEELEELGTEVQEYDVIHANSIEDLVHKVSDYAYNISANSVMTENEKRVGQMFDFKG